MLQAIKAEGGSTISVVVQVFDGLRQGPAQHHRHRQCRQGQNPLLSVLALVTPAEERIVTVEQEAEFRLRQEHVVALERRTPNREGKGEISVGDLRPAAHDLDRQPERVLIGELSLMQWVQVLAISLPSCVVLTTTKQGVYEG